MNSDKIKDELKKEFEFVGSEQISGVTAFRLICEVLDRIQSQKQSAVWVVKSHTGSIADTGDYYTQYYLENESAGKSLLLSSDNEEDYFEMADYLNAISQPQLSESEIEKLAEKEYPYPTREMSKEMLEARKVSILSCRTHFIKGLKYKLTATPQQADEVQ